MAKQRAAGRILGRHGSALAYDTGCRCDLCREAHNAKSRRQKATARAVVSSAEGPAVDGES